MTERGTRPRAQGIAAGALALLAAAFAGGVPGSAEAHGGVSMEADWCVLRLGDYKAHFTGYQPAESGSREFCEDIPKAGEAIIVLDFFDRELREYEVDFRLVENWTGLGNAATAASLGSDEEIEKHTLLYVPRQRYDTGTVTIRYRFDRPGYFVGIVTASREGRLELRSVFPFAVGVFHWQRYALAAGGLLAAGAMGWLALRGRRRRQAKTTPEFPAVRVIERKLKRA